MYTLAIQFLDQALVDPSVKQPNKDVQQCRASYAARIASLRQEMAGSLNTLPQPPAYTAQAQPETATALAVPQDKAVTTQDPTVMQVGVSAIKVSCPLFARKSSLSRAYTPAPPPTTSRMNGFDFV